MSSPITSHATGNYMIITYGCQMNSNDSEIMSGILSSLGYTETDNESDADVIIINTCVVRGGAEDRALGRLENLISLRHKKPHLTIIVAGCLAQKDGENLLRDLPQTDIILGTRDLFDLGNVLRRHLETGERIVATNRINQPVFLGQDGPVCRKSGLKGFVTIMYGCNNFCSYCIVPTTRGRETSRPAQDIIAEVQMLANNGYREVQLLGQNVNSYKDNDIRFPKLLELVSQISGIERIRFVTSHPKDLTDELIEAMASLPKVCESIHLPAQAGNDRVLKSMNRHYTSNHYRELLSKLHNAMRDVVVTTDLIVGFPGETQEEFEDTLHLVQDAKWDSAFMFMYSPRPGTRSADTMPETVSIEDKKARLQQLIDLQEAICLERNRRWIGQSLEVLVETVSHKRDTELMGRTRGDLSVVFSAPKELIGKIVQVKITESFAHTLRGELITNIQPK